MNRDDNFRTCFFLGGLFCNPFQYSHFVVWMWKKYCAIKWNADWSTNIDKKKNRNLRCVYLHKVHWIDILLFCTGSHHEKVHSHRRDDSWIRSNFGIFHVSNVLQFLIPRLYSVNNLHVYKFTTCCLQELTHYHLKKSEHTSLPFIALVSYSFRHTFRQ